MRDIDVRRCVVRSSKQGAFTGRRLLEDEKHSQQNNADIQYRRRTLNIEKKAVVLA